MGVVQNIVSMVRDIHDRQKTAEVDEQLKNYLNNPDATISAVSKIDGRWGIALQNQHISDMAARDKARRDSGTADLAGIRDVMRGLPAGTDYGKAFDDMGPTFAALGVYPQGLAGLKSAVVANPNILMDDKAYENWSKDQYANTVAPIGSHVIRGGQVIDKVPFAAKPVTTQAGATTSIFDPNANDGTGAFVTSAGGGVPGAAASPGAGGPLTSERLMPIFAAQESRGSGDYTAFNKSGAMGRYQLMPADARRAAQKAGLSYRPDMMVKDDQQSRTYQDKLGAIRVQESIDASGGDPAKLFSHYYSGSPTAYLNPEGNPKTARYTQEMLGRLGNDGGAAIAPPPGGATITPTSVSVPAKAGLTYRAATPQELAGYPAGTAGQIGNDGKLVNLKAPSAAAQKMTTFDFDKANAGVDATNKLLAGVTGVLAMPGLAGATGSIQGRIPGLLLGGQVQDARNALAALRSNVGLQQLMAAKATSAQGASGFGNLSNAEGERLEKAWGSLDDTTSDSVIRQNLNGAMGILRRANERIRWQVDQAQAGQSWRVPPEGTERHGYRFLGGSPANQDNWQKVSR